MPHLNPLKIDPTRTVTLRRAFTIAITKRLRLIKGNVLRYFGITKNQFEFASSAEQVEEFGKWLEDQFDALTTEEAYGRYIKEGFAQGQRKAFLRAKALGMVTQGNEQFLLSAFLRPQSADKVKLLTGRVLTELKNVNSAMATAMKRELADGLVKGESPRVIARKINKQVDKIGKVKARMIARTEISRAHNEGQLDRLEELGVEEVGVEVEWLTAENPCPICSANAGNVYKLNEAHGLIPAHPNCLCSWIPHVRR